MKKILLVKITSMGDLIQMLPAITDAANAFPGIQIDWLAEESFKDVPQLHPFVHKIITLPYRRWKKNIRQAIQSGEISQFWRTLRHEHYDMVIDAQSNLKSAFVSLLTKGLKLGLDAQSVREYGAHFAYHKKFKISRMQNHADRMRQMMAMLLGYEQPITPADYGIKDNLPPIHVDLPEQFIFLAPFASCSNKLWPEPFWQELIELLVEKGHELVLSPFGEKERQVALKLKNNHPHVHLLPTLTLTQKASVISRANAAISVDTGLAHLTAALNVPNVCLYGPTNPDHCGTVGANQIHLRAIEPKCAPCLKTQCNYQEQSSYQPACLSSIMPKRVLNELDYILEVSGN